MPSSTRACKSHTEISTIKVGGKKVHAVVEKVTAVVQKVGALILG
jgi:hypothetical protein